MNKPRPSLTEKTAAIAWARAWNTRDLELLRPLVHPSARFTDQRSWEPRIGTDRYLQQIQDYFDHMPAEQYTTRMELGQIPSPVWTDTPPRPCVIEYCRGRPFATILFRVRGGSILLVEKRFLPPPTECVLSGLYPGLEETLDLAEVN